MNQTTQYLLVLLGVLLAASCARGLPSLQVTAEAEQVYVTGFETATVSPLNWNLDGMDLDPTYGKEISNYVGNDDNDYGRAFIEGVDRTTSGFTPHTGQRCLGLEVQRPSAMSTRASFAVWPAGGGGDNPAFQLDITNKVFLREWLFMPADWSMSSSNPWYSLLQMGTYPTTAPYYAMHIIAPPASGVPAGTLRATLDYRNAGYAYSKIATYDNFQDVLPLGQWFKLEWYCFKDAEAGTIMVWLNNMLIFNLTELDTFSPPINQFDFNNQVYFDEADLTYQIRWIDDLEIWNGLPPDLGGNGADDGNGDDTLDGDQDQSPANGQTPSDLADDLQSQIGDVPESAWDYMMFGTVAVCGGLIVYFTKFKKGG